MAYRTNYNQQRIERDRAKQAKKEEKLRERQEGAARRKAGEDPQEAEEDQTATSDSTRNAVASGDGAA